MFEDAASALADYGPLTPILKTAGFLVSAAVGLVVLLWGKGVVPGSLGAETKPLFRVVVGIVMIAALAAALAFSSLLGTKTLFYSMLVLLIATVAAIVVLATIALAPQGGTRWKGPSLASNIVAVIASSLTLLFAALLVERAATTALPLFASVEGGGEPGSMAVKSLRGIETARAVLTLDGKVWWQTTVPGPAGQVEIEWGIMGRQTEGIDVFAVTLGVPNAGDPQPSGLATRAVPIDIPASAQAPGVPLPVFVRVKSCSLMQPTPTPPPPGQKAHCFFSVIVKAEPLGLEAME